MTPLSLTDEAKRLNTPPFQGRGRGWGLTAERLALLHVRAAEMRRNPGEPERRLWRALCASQFNGHKFRRQAVIGAFIADFFCPQRGLVIEVDGDTHESEQDRRRDEALAAHGVRTLRVSNHEVMTNLGGVLAAIADALTQAPRRWQPPHPNPSPEGEGL